MFSFTIFSTFAILALHSLSQFSDSFSLYFRTLFFFPTFSLYFLLHSPFAFSICLLTPLCRCIPIFLLCFLFPPSHLLSYFTFSLYIHTPLFLSIFSLRFRFLLLLFHSGFSLFRKQLRIQPPPQILITKIIQRIT